MKIIYFILKSILPLVIIILLIFYYPILGVISAVAFILFKLYSGRAGIFSFIGKINYSKGNISSALDWLGKAYKNGKQKPQTVILYAYLLLKAGNIGECENILNKLLNTKISTDEAMLAKSNLALVLWKKNCLDEAVALLEEIIVNFKTSAIYGSLGYLLILKGDFDKALAFNQEAYEYNSSDKVILDNLGQTYYLKGEYDKAEEIFEMLVSKNPAFPEAYYNYGLVLIKKGREQEALEQFKKALNCNISFLSTITKDEIESKMQEISPRAISNGK